MGEYVYRLDFMATILLKGGISVAGKKNDASLNQLLDQVMATAKSSGLKIRKKSSSKK